MNRFAYTLVGSATAQIAIHRLGDLLIAGLGRLSEESGGGHNLSRLAVAALGNFFGEPGLLQRMKSVRAQAFDCGHVLIGDLRDRGRARADRIALDMNGACAAESGAAAELGAGKLKRVAQNPEQRCFGGDGDLLLTTVNAECDVSHGCPVLGF